MKCELCVKQIKNWIAEGNVNKLMEYINIVKKKRGNKCQAEKEKILNVVQEKKK